MKRDNDKNYYSPKPYDIYRNASKVMGDTEEIREYSKLEDDNFYREIENEIKRHENIGKGNKPNNPHEPVNIKEQKKDVPKKEERHYYSIYDEIAERRKKQKQSLGIYRDTNALINNPVKKKSVPNIEKKQEIYSHSDSYNYSRKSFDFSAEEDNFDENTEPQDYYYKRASHKGLWAVLISLFAVILLGLAGIILYVNGVFNNILPSNATEQTETTVQVTETTEAPTENVLLDSQNFIKAQPEDDNTEGYFENNLYLWNDKAFELFYGTEIGAVKYAEAINYCAESLGEQINVYNMVVPTHIEMGLPERFISDGVVNTNSQSDNISTIYKNLSDKVTPVNCYNYLSQNTDKYLYFGGDHHWTGLGAYYAYKAYTDKLETDQLDIETCTENIVDGFYGSLACSVSAELPADKVSFWTLPYDTANTIYFDGADKAGTSAGVYYTQATGGANTYGVFLWGDQPLEVISSKSNKVNGKIAVIKDSYGNAFAPYLTYNYREVHVIDFRYFDKNLKEYLTVKEIDNVLFMNGVMSANSEVQVNKIRSMVE